MGLQGTGALSGLTESVSESVLAPLPTITGRFRYALTPRWILDFNAGYFAIEVDLGDGSFDGSVISASGGIKWRPIEWLSFGLHYQWFDVDVDVDDDDDLNWVVDYKYKGPVLWIGTQF